MGAPTSSDDPLAIFLQPPPNETPGERAARVTREAAEKAVSDSIDADIKEEKARMKKRDMYAVRVLLLGQAESGKSTTLKNFRMRFAKDAWDAERASWRAVIQLNVVRSVISIVEALQAEMDGDSIDPLEVPNTPLTPVAPGVQPQSMPAILAVANPPSALPQHESFSTRKISSTSLSTALTAKHQLLKMRLGPLRRVSHDLRRRLGEGASEEFEEGLLDGTGLFGEGDTTEGGGGGGPSSDGHGLSLESASQSLAAAVNRSRTREFGVRRVQEALSLAVGGGGGGGGGDARAEGGVDEATEVLAGCLEDMKTLWADEVVRVVLKKRRIRLEETAGFFLDDLDRIAKRDYTPSDDDVVRARLRTVGVQEYRIRFDHSNHGVLGSVGGDVGREWLLYDVGGSRTMRHAWVPFFDNVQAIIFLAPVSCFDERLSEDSKVNRLEDSFLLWRYVCSSKLLAKATMILFLNKCDLLKRKLKSGVQVKTFLPSYGARPNDVGTVVKYLREKFKEVLKENSPSPRGSYFYATSVIDTTATAVTINAVKDSILRDYLKNADFV